MKKRLGKKKPAKTKTALFAGRFQPFHNGHYRILQGLLRKYRVIVAIGSADRHDADNPFSAWQRKKMIQACFPDQPLEFAFIADAPDRTWVNALLKKVPGRRFDFVFSNNPRVQKRLRKAGILYISGPMIRRQQLEGKRIRTWPQGWQKAVPKAAARFIQAQRSYGPIGTIAHA